MNIVITGVTRGLGRALAEWYIANGHTVAGCGRSGPAIFDFRFTHPEPNSFDAVDVTLPVKVSLWSERVLGALGAPDILINNAGLINAPAPLWKVPPEEMGRVVSVNILGVVNVIRAFAPAMIERGKGVIVNMSSGWGRSVAPDVAPYCATKWAIEGLTQALAQELPGDGRRPAQSRRDRYRHAPDLLPGKRLVLPEGRRVGQDGGAVHPGPWTQGQRAVAERRRV